MSIWQASDYSQHPVFSYLRTEGVGRIDIEKIFDAFSGHPPLVSSVTDKFSDLRGLGFDNPVKMVTTLPAILGYAIENIRTKLADLRGLGFDNPVKMVTTLPAILGYAIENIRTKLADLRGLGFDNPVKMVTTLPAILGLAIENIRTKLSALNQMGFDGHALVSSWPTVTSYSPHRVLFVASVVKSVDEGNVSLFTDLMSKEPVAVGAAATDPDVKTIAALRARLRERKGRTAENLALLRLRNGPIVEALAAYYGPFCSAPERAAA